MLYHTFNPFLSAINFLSNPIQYETDMSIIHELVRRCQSRLQLPIERYHYNTNIPEPFKNLQTLLEKASHLTSITAIPIWDREQDCKKWFYSFNEEPLTPIQLRDILRTYLTEALRLARVYSI